MSFYGDFVDIYLDKEDLQLYYREEICCTNAVPRLYMRETAEEIHDKLLHNNFYSASQRYEL